MSNKDKPISVRLSDKTYAELKEEADKTRKTVSELVRARVEANQANVNDFKDLAFVLGKIVDKMDDLEGKSLAHSRALRALLKVSGTSVRLLDAIIPATVGGAKKEALMEEGSRFGESRANEFGLSE